MRSEIDEIIERVRNYEGVLRKRPIQNVVRALSCTQVYGKQLPSYGDDAAVIPWGDGFLLLAADGMMTGLLLHEPYAAGKASIMVTVNDIYSMGGRPLGLVNVLACGEDEQLAGIVEGIAKGCMKLKVPMLGGHLHPDAPKDQPSLSVAILGWAKKVLRSHLAEEGDDLILAVDLDGRPGCRSVVSWDANSGKTSEQILDRLDAMPRIAESELSVAAKDVSNAGILGTAAVMMENSGKGAVIHLDRIPRPDAVSLADWLLCFQSFGFVLAVPPRNTDTVLDLFKAKGVTADKVGRVTGDSKVRLIQGGRSVTLFDLDREAITGIRYRPGAKDS